MRHQSTAGVELDAGHRPQRRRASPRASADWHQGEACEKLADGNELVLQLQKQSRDNKEKNARKLYEQTVRALNYGEYLDAFDKNLVQLPNGKFAAYDMETYTRLRKDFRGLALIAAAAKVAVDEPVIEP